MSDPKVNSAPAPDERDRFIHRDLSWLAFNGRVLEEADEPENPLLERARFLAIFANNLDEFIMVRVAGLKRLLDAQYNRQDIYGYYPQDVYREVRETTAQLVERLYGIYEQKLKPELARNNIFIRRIGELTADQQKFAKRFFDSTLYPIITPMAIDQGHPFPVLASKTLAFAVHLLHQELIHLAVIPVPQSIPRIVKLPSAKDSFEFILIDEIIRDNLKSFFRGYEITGASLFRLIRDSELSVDEEFSPNLLESIEEEIKKRPRAKVVQLSVEQSCPELLLDAVMEAAGFFKEEVTRINGEIDLTFLFQLVGLAGVPALFYPSYSPARMQYENIFDRIKEEDFILHMPYQSFQPTVDLIKAAAVDPNVLAIKMTLYRASEDSEIVQALKTAAKNKKQVTVLVEIKARFDEERNIGWARQLEESGCYVIYGIAGMKIHSKITLIVRREENRTRRYVHLSTGNYNEKTARVYTDIGYFTANDDFARDISDVFNVISGYSQPARWKRVISSPYDLREYFFELIDKEIEFQRAYKNGFVFAKMNSLEDTRMIDKLYEASREGVKVHLIVRGICVLVPGVPGLSENIVVKSLVGRFLEHSRIFLFNNNSEFRMFLSSADWMSRNLDRRIELLFEIHRQELKDHLRFVLEQTWKDNQRVRLLLSQRTYSFRKAEEDRFNAQDYFIKHYG
ncbi:MAG: polyphosphate kinase 1 [Candidatus Omnitrophica bacterium]|nr:polyphosphate kinase 1 [Candidatus Omnitrophota bacterium]